VGAGRRRQIMRTVSGLLKSFVVVLALVVLCAVVFPDPATAARTRTVSTKLTGKEQVPPVFTKGHGNIEIKLDPSMNTICFELKVRDLSSPPTEMHIHQGLPGTDGPRRAQLVPVMEGKSEGCALTEPNRTENLIRVISKHPERFYVAVHTGEFPEGELRGQLEKGPLSAK
jgi:hypothetical protein